MSPIPERTIEGETLTAPIAVPANSSPVFDVRDYGWENISLPVPNHVEQALATAGLNWLVEKKKVYVDGMSVPERWANCRSDKPPGENVLEIVGSKYKIIQNHEALGFVQDVLNLGNVQLERAGSFDKGRTVYLLGKTKGLRVAGDDIMPYLLFSNSHDGSSSVKVCLTTFRISCKNTLAAAIKGAPRIWSVPHVKSAVERMKAAQASMNFIGNYLTVYPMFVERMVDTPVSDAQFALIADALFPIPPLDVDEKNARAHANAVDANETFQIIYEETRDLNSIRGTAWGVWNAYSDYVSHKPSARSTEHYEANRFQTNFVGRNLERAQQTILAMV